jgi:hypothetical protein
MYFNQIGKSPTPNSQKFFVIFSTKHRQVTTAKIEFHFGDALQDGVSLWRRVQIMMMLIPKIAARWHSARNINF